MKNLKPKLVTIKDADQQKKKCKTVFGTQEWAEMTHNIQNGCSNDCLYCYAKSMAIRFKRAKPDTWKNEIIREADLKKNFKKIEGTYMFPSSHDITPKHLNESMLALHKLLSAGNKVLVVSKPHIECVRRICSEFTQYRDQILFRFTIGSSDSTILKLWEPGAPTFQERLECLKIAYKLGYKTSISCEPMLDFYISQVIDKTLPFVTDSIWLGKANKLLYHLKMNGITDPATLNRTQELVEWQTNDTNILKLYSKYKNNSKIKWKESIKKVVGLAISTQKGLDK